MPRCPKVETTTGIGDRGASHSARASWVPEKMQAKRVGHVSQHSAKSISNVKQERWWKRFRPVQIQLYNMSWKKYTKNIKNYACTVTTVSDVRLACNSKPLSLNSASVNTEGATWSAEVFFWMGKSCEKKVTICPSQVSVFRKL